MTAEMPFTRREFLDAVTKRISRQGYYGMSFGSNPTTATSPDTGLFQEAHKSILIQWVEDAGFRVIREFSYYGVPTYFVVLRWEERA